ncbi:hypothetical protein AB0N77_20600 [Streptomyces misionensis]|uniref:hypothetical protein n=1 Tax=Streptomyces misionensis TaxID=67331 RepID=UPI003414BF2B
MATDAPLGSSPTLVTAPARSARSVVLVLLAGSLLLKAGGFAWDYLSYYVATETGQAPQQPAPPSPSSVSAGAWDRPAADCSPTGSDNAPL